MTEKEWQKLLGVWRTSTTIEVPGKKVMEIIMKEVFERKERRDYGKGSKKKV